MVCDIVTENLIKGIIVAHSRTGITIKQIANVYHQCTGDHWPFVGIEMGPIQYLQQIDGILSIDDNDTNEKLWYVRGKTFNGENRGKIYRSKNQPIASSKFDLSNKSTWQQPHGSSQSNTCNQYDNSGNNNFGNGRSSSSGGIGNSGWERNNNGYINRNTNTNNYASRNNMQQRFYKNNGMDANGHGFGLSNATGTCDSPGGNRPKTSAVLNDYDLVGDDFFLAMAKIDLECIVTNRKRIHRSGLCISGQSIHDATERIRRLPVQSNMKMIINLGSIDILHGNDLTDMCQNYKELVKVCDRRRIEIVITTLAPLANRLHCKCDTMKLHQFNEFLVKQFSTNYRVIDITSCMVNEVTDKLLFSCYQPVPKYMTGTNQPHTLWNRIGRQRILKKIKSNLPV